MTTEVALLRACSVCGGPMEGKRPHAVYCDKKCKVKASERRRIEDGRSITRDRARYAKEAEHRRAYAMEYLRRNPERMRAIRRKRKGQLKAERLLFTEKDWARLKARFRGLCAYCGGPPRIALQREHVVPLVKGGRHSIGNILPACESCNGSKKSRFLSDWRYRVLAPRGEVICQ